MAHGADAVATGHHARNRCGSAAGPSCTGRGTRERPVLRPVYSRFQAARVDFIARRRDHQRRGPRPRAHAELPVAEKNESQDVCFAPGGDLAGVVEKTLGSAGNRPHPAHRREGPRNAPGHPPLHGGAAPRTQDTQMPIPSTSWPSTPPPGRSPSAPRSTPRASVCWWTNGAGIRRRGEALRSPRAGPLPARSRPGKASGGGGDNGDRMACRTAGGDARTGGRCLSGRNCCGGGG